MWLLTEQDLLHHEPRLIRDCRSVGVKTFTGTASVTNGLMSVLAVGVLQVPFVVQGTPVWFPDTETTALVASEEGGGDYILTLASGQSDEPAAPNYIRPPNASSVTFEVYTFPQLRTAGELVVAELGIDQVVGPRLGTDRSVVHAASMLALAMIFRTMAVSDRTVFGGTGNTLSVFNTRDMYWKLSESYEERYRQTMRRSKLLVDANRDGLPDEPVPLGTTITRRT